MHKIYLFIALIVSSIWSAMAVDLTVVVAIEGADESTFTTLLDSWGKGNLHQWSDGATIHSVHYPHWLQSNNEILATFLTGVMPAEHGICSDSAFIKETRTVENIFHSPRSLGIGTQRGYDCEALLVPTMTDLLRMRQGISPRIYAIGIQPSTTMLLAGKAANACCWMEKKEPNDWYHWVSTSYYKEGLPSAADRMNINGELNRQIRRQDGTNVAIVELALMLQMEKQLGSKQSEDVLLLQLDGTGELNYMIETLLRRIGKDHLHLILLGLPTPLLQGNMTEWNFETKTFNLNRIVALTSSYLMALYGYERWLDGGYGQSIYLNHSLIQSKGLNLETIRQQVAEFLLGFDGVRYACSIRDAYLREDLQTSIHKRFAGDVVFELQGNYLPTLTQPAVMVVNENPNLKLDIEYLTK